MKRLLLFALLVSTTTTFAQPKIIFDTDFGGDADDLGALAMLHNFVDRGECDLLAIMCWSTEEFAIPALDAVSRFYNHPDIPIGVRKAEPYREVWTYNKAIADSLYHERAPHDAPDAVGLYRQLLAESEDSSIVIVTVGPLANIKNLLLSKPDSISELTGKELIHKKVREFAVMGGQFPEGDNEWNFDGDMPGVTRYVLEHLDVPITFSGFEVGDDIRTGAVFNEIDPHTPLYVGFKHFSEFAPWMKEYYEGKIQDNATYDQTAVLYAVRGGVGTWWDRIAGGTCVPDSTGGNIWVEGDDSNHSYLKLTVDQGEMAQLIEAIMLNEF